MHSLEIVQWNSTKRDHTGNPGGVSGSGPITTHINIVVFLYSTLYSLSTFNGHVLILFYELFREKLLLPFEAAPPLSSHR